MGEWPKPGLCDAQFCSKEGQALLECSCEDGSHTGAGGKTTDEEAEQGF